LKAVNPDRPEDYYDRGVIMSAKAMANETRQSVFVPLIVTDGEHIVKPKTAKNPPFIEPVTRGQTVTHRIVAILEVTPGRRKSRLIRLEDGDIQVSEIRGRLSKLQAEMIRIFKQETGIEDYLIQTVNEWGETHDMVRAAANLAEQAADDERLVVLTDRIRALHPRLTGANLGQDISEINNVLPITIHSDHYPFRKAAQIGLLNLLANPDPERLNQTLGAVTALVGASEYRDWRS
jgi:hypothetical protein